MSASGFQTYDLSYTTNRTQIVLCKLGLPDCLSQQQVLRKKAKSGQSLPCGNNCGKKFASYKGYEMHMKICGKERETFSCQVCGKVYQSEPGLKYHMTAVHEVS